MIKWLLLLAGAGLFYLWLKGKKQAKFDREQSSSPRTGNDQTLTEPKTMIQCQHCKVHLPQSDAILHDGRFYCSKQHLDVLDPHGWLGVASRHVSPNKDPRPEGVAPELLVIHHISLPPGEFQSRASNQHIINFFQNTLDPNAHPYFAEIAEQKVSSHFLITRSGELIQFVSAGERAWHAGASSFMGRERCNDFSIGVELEGDGETPFEDAQYTALAGLVQKLLRTYPNLQFAGHSDISPGRKTDPGKYFDWGKFQKETGISEEKIPYGVVSR
ncbi:1,6-anhydro-N-acetylmuramyl-L-alanine amidase AmpD [Polynucleobacter sp. UB-Raua-W9]|uniref:1,6-anhydro-N-acetylmuramyl-L-alanine amidase AmpD n=1 Tax=Polynucleobacter sp. UB-Raua-W9 TaxID=1819736 RepID=UPI0021125719|nr:1,6-anhydro-N-acetylmuramyl-L-alanine amidase AmpD [Polynucleobacter sp. UB-Raua-W9]